MRAAVLHEYGVPTPGEFEDPEPGPGQAVVDVLAAGVNPVDVSICAGRFYAGKPPLPSVAGREGVGMLLAELMRIKAEGDYNAIQALINQARTDADMTNSKCAYADTDVEAALICSLFESAPVRTDPLFSRKSVRDASAAVA